MNREKEGLIKLDKKLNTIYLRFFIDVYFDFIENDKPLTTTIKNRYKKYKKYIINLRELFNSDLYVNSKHFVIYKAVNDTLYLMLEYIILIDNKIKIGSVDEK